MSRSSSQSMMARCVIIGIILYHSQVAKAGWSGAMNGTGYGWASVNVVSKTLHSNTVQSANMISPSAAMKTTAGYSAGAALPAGSSTATVARIKGAAGYIWTADTVGSGGDKTDNPSIDQLINVTPSECASLEMSTSTTMSSNGQSGVIVVNTSATGGAAILLRGYEYDNPTPPQSLQDLESNANSFLLWHVLMTGPFDLNSTNCNAVVIPFTIQTSETNIYFVADAEVKSLPLELTCPSNIVVSCGQPVVYEQAFYSACGTVTAVYDPPADSSFPLGTTPVTLTITDQFGNTTNCTFTVDVVDKSTPATPVLEPLVYSDCEGGGFTPPIPTTTDNCTGTVYGTTTTHFPITNLGLTVVTWTFNDGNGNSVTATQDVTLTGLTFKGFGSPINGAGGTCSAPLCVSKCGNTIPIDFTLFCGSTCVTSGKAPVVEIVPYSNNCSPEPCIVTANAVYQRGEWVYDWTTSRCARGVYQVIVTLPDGTSDYVFIRLN